MNRLHKNVIALVCAMVATSGVTFSMRKGTSKYKEFYTKQLFRLFAEEIEVPQHLFKAHVDFFIEHDADVSYRSLNDPHDNHSLHYAAAQGNSDAIATLVKHGAQKNAVNTNGNTPLHVAVLNGQIKACEKLLNLNANPNARNNDGNTPLHLAIREKSAPIVHLLLAHKARTNIKNKLGQTSLHYAILTRGTSIIKPLLKHDADDRVTGNIFIKRRGEYVYESPYQFARFHLCEKNPYKKSQKYGAKVLKILRDHRRQKSRAFRGPKRTSRATQTNGTFSHKQTGTQRAKIGKGQRIKILKRKNYQIAN